MHCALRHRAWITLLLLLIVTDRTQAQQNPKLTPINYGNIVLTASTWPFLIAEQEGFFQREGIDFKRVIGGNTTATTQALVAGSTDIAQMNLVNLLAANSAGADLIVIGGDSTVPIYTLIVHSSIKSYADLKGKRLAITGPTDPLALASGFSSLGLSTDYVDNFQYTITGARRDWAQKNRALVVRFLRAYVKACEFFYDPKNKEAAVRALAERTKSEKDEAEKTYALYMKTQKTIPRDGGIDVQGARKVAENWKDFGLQKTPPPVDGVIDLSYLAEARK